MMRSSVVLFFSVFAHILFAQAVSDEVYRSAVDVLNCKAVEFSLRDSKDPGLEKFQRKCDCNKIITYEQLTYALNETNAGVTIELSKEIEALKRESIGRKTADQLLKYLTVDIFEDKGRFAKLYAFENKRARKQSSQYREFKEGLKARLLEDFEVAKNISEQNQAARIDNRISSLERQVSDFRDNNNATKSVFPVTLELDVFAIMLTTVFFIVILYQTKQRRRRRAMEQESTWHNQTSVFDRHNQGAHAEISRLRREMDDLRKEIAQYECKLDSRTSSGYLRETRESLFNRESVEDTGNSFVENSNLGLLYFSTPDADGSFSETSGHSSYREGASIYRLTKLSSTRAKFQIDDSESSIKLALQYPDRNIDPVCEAVNAFNPKSRTITTIDDGAGMADLIGDRWKVYQKAKIRYEV